MDTLFIAGGIHADELSLQGSPAQGNAGALWDDAALQQLAQQHGVQPTRTMAFMQW